MRLRTAVAAFVVVIGVCSSACRADAIRTVANANAQVEVELLTTFDGVRLYRVNVGNRDIFIAVNTERAEVAWTEQQGKVTVPMDTQTVKKPR